MKKVYILLGMFLLTISLVSCDFEFNTIPKTTTTDISTTISDTTTISTTTSTTTTMTTPISTVPTTTMTTDTEESYFRPTGYNTLQDVMEIGIPSIGTPKVLVFAVDFTDAPASEATVSLTDVNSVFNGTSKQLTFESLNSFYLKSSYGQLDLTADVYGFYTMSHTAEYYEQEFDRFYEIDPSTGNYYTDTIHVESTIVQEVLAYYDDQIDYSDYDYNNDGFIDGVYIVYSHDVSFSNGSDLWWAWQTHYYDAYVEGSSTFDGVEPNYLCWSGSEFMTHSSDNLDARTVIHETGHMMGLDDYYDYSDADDYNSGGLGRADMMDGAIGDHGPFSKLLLGWINPIVVTSTQTIDLEAYIENGETILIIDEWNNTIFDEYILVSLYTPYGLYTRDKSEYFNDEGIAMYHVCGYIGQGYNSPNYYTIFNYNNTDSLFKVVKYIEADTSVLISDTGLVDNEDLFNLYDVFGDTLRSDYEWYSGDPVGFDLEVLSISLSYAELVITFE